MLSWMLFRQVPCQGKHGLYSIILPVFEEKWPTECKIILRLAMERGESRDGTRSADGGRADSVLKLGGRGSHEKSESSQNPGGGRRGKYPQIPENDP
jgi:hypothetical protein